MSGPTVLSVASEVFPLIKTGGLADVAGALPGALAREGIACRTLLPGYPAVLKSLESAEAVATFANKRQRSDCLASLEAKRVRLI